MAPTTGFKGLKAKKVDRLKQTNDAGVHKPPKPHHRSGYVHVPPLISAPVSESSTVSEASFSHLPPELKIQIFGFLDSVSAVTALSSTSRTFNSIWKVNVNHICDAIIQRTIESPVEAKALIDAQQSMRRTKDKRKLKKVRRDQSGCQKAVRRLHQYLTNKDMASLALNYFEDSLLRHSEISRRFSSTERGHFMQAYYRSMVLVLLSPNKRPVSLILPQSALNEIPISLITPWSMLEYKRVYEILEFIFTRPPFLVPEEWSKPLLGIRRNQYFKCGNAFNILKLLEDHLVEDFPEIYPSSPYHDPVRYFTTYNLDVKATDKLGSVRLAEVIPRLRYWSL